MNKLARSILVTLALILPSGVASAENLNFVWEYPVAEEAQILGYHIYRDGNILEPVTLAPSARSAVVVRQTDKKSHAYFITAYTADDESGPSQTALDIYVPGKISTPIKLTFTVTK